jgi:hypothetical protein
MMWLLLSSYYRKVLVDWDPVVVGRERRDLEAAAALASPTKARPAT